MRGPAIKERKREEAKVRRALRETRGDEQQLRNLIVKGHGHCKEADRLRAKLGIDEENTK